MAVLSILFCYICILLSVAFFTLLERKGLSYIQARKGPNKVGFFGLPQPLSDAAKLLTKEVVKPIMSNSIPYFIAPVFSFILSLLLWQLYPSVCSVTYFKLGVLFFLCVSSLNVYGTMLAGWSSNSKYAYLGSIRAVAQTISYEISMALIVFFPLFMLGSLSFIEVSGGQSNIWLLFTALPIFFMWMVSCMAETNRSPFDFAEGESELVSGFNTEYGSVGFALIFLAEYANIYVMALLSVMLFMGGASLFSMESDFILMVKVLGMSFVFIWVRGSYPRFRYDLLMNLTWKSFLPVSLCALCMVVCLSYLLLF